MAEYVRYYHEDRTHLGLRKDTPAGRLSANHPAIGSSIRVADGTYWIHRIPDPILIVRDQYGATAPFEPYMLLSATRSEGTLSPKVDFVLLPDAKPVSLRGHYFEGNEQPLADVITKWLTALHL